MWSFVDQIELDCVVPPISYIAKASCDVEVLYKLDSCSSRFSGFSSVLTFTVYLCTVGYHCCSIRAISNPVTKRHTRSYCHHNTISNTDKAFQLFLVVCLIDLVSCHWIPHPVAGLPVWSRNPAFCFLPFAFCWQTKNTKFLPAET